MAFSAPEYRDMHFVYGLCNGSAVRAAEEYANRYPRRRHPHHSVFPNLHRRMGEQDCLTPHREGGRPVNPRHGQLEQDVLDIITEDPTTSTRKIARTLRSDKSTVHAIMKGEGLYPYHLTPTQQLVPGDEETRSHFCRWLIAQNEMDPLFIYNVCWTDESMFTRQGIFNQHNIHYWNYDNPHLARTHKFQYQWQRLNVWGAILGNDVEIRLLPDTLNGGNYLNFLEHTLEELLPEGPGVRDVWFQQDGAPPHSTRAVTQYLTQNFGDQWIGRYGPIRWPPRSPDLTPLDFFLWGYIKGEVYAKEAETPEALIAMVHAAIAAITPAQLESVRQEILDRARRCLLAEGGKFEHLPK